MEGQILNNLPLTGDTLYELTNELSANTCSFKLFQKGD